MFSRLRGSPRPLSSRKRRRSPPGGQALGRARGACSAARRRSPRGSAPGRRAAGRRARRPAGRRRCRAAGGPRRACARRRRARRSGRCSGATSATGMQPVGGQADVERDAAVDARPGAGEVLERLAPDGEHGVGGRRARRAARAPARRRAPRPRRGRSASARSRSHGTRSRSPAPSARRRRGRRWRRRSGSCPRSRRPWKTTVSASASGEAVDAQRDRGGRVGVDQGPPEQLARLGPLHARRHAVPCSSIVPSCPGSGYPFVDQSAENVPDEALYKPFGIVLGILAGFISRKLSTVWGHIDD